MTLELERLPIELPEVPCDTPEDHQGKGFVDEKIRKLMTDRNLYAQIQEHRHREWTEIVRAFEAEPGDFYRAWHYLNQHPLFWCVGGRRNKPMPVHEKHLIHDRGVAEGLDLSVVKVDPNTRRVEMVEEGSGEDPNTQTEVWYELCFHRWGAQYDDVRVHVWQADGGGDTYEEAVLKAAQQVHDLYGNDRQIFDRQMAEDRKGVDRLMDELRGRSPREDGEQ